MDGNYAAAAVNAVLNGELSYCKFLSANDTGATGAHQVGILVSISAKEIMFDESLEGHHIIKRSVEINWQDQICTQSTFTFYSSKGELRITRLGRNFPFLVPDQTGSLFVLVRFSSEFYKAYFLDTEDEIEQFLAAFSLSAADTNRIIHKESVTLEGKEKNYIDRFISELNVEFPTSYQMSSAARSIYSELYNGENEIISNPDKKLIEWTQFEYSLFMAIENARYGKRITSGFSSVDEFIDLANRVLNRRKSRAGHSLEHHLTALFEGNNLTFSAQAVTEGNKRPDFLFPSQSAYHDSTFPTNKLISLAAKTTCKDRWRQILNEADRLKGRPLYLCTLQQGISAAQIDEMTAENVTLVVPKYYIGAYPKEKRDLIWTLAKFIAFAKETACFDGLCKSM